MRHRESIHMMAAGARAIYGVRAREAMAVRTLIAVPPNDLSTLAGSGIVLAGAAIAAGWLPAWRASRIDPAGLLRES